MHPPPPSQGAGRSSPTPTPNPSLAFAPPSSTPSPGSSTALAMQPRRCRRRRSREGRPRGKALEASRSFGGRRRGGAGERRAVKILGMGGGGRGGFARCTTRFLDAFFSFVTELSLLRLLVMVAKMAKLRDLCIQLPGIFLLSSNRA